MSAGAAYGRGVVTLAGLQAEVESRYERLDLPAWPNPHPLPDTGERDEEEYSRVTEPGRYRIVHARAQAWTSVLEETLGAHAEALAPGPATVPGLGQRPFERGRRVDPPRSGVLPLVLLEREVPPSTGDTAALPVLLVGVAHRDAVVADYPDCGCDACDFGSADLLQAVDETIGAVVGGPYVALRGRGWRAEWHPDGASASGSIARTDFQALQDLCRRLADGESVPLPEGTTEVHVGRSWLDDVTPSAAGPARP